MCEVHTYMYVRMYTVPTVHVYLETFVHSNDIISTCMCMYVYSVALYDLQNVHDIQIPYMQCLRTHIYCYSGTSLLRTLWDLDFSPYYRGVLNSEVT